MIPTKLDSITRDSTRLDYIVKYSTEGRDGTTITIPLVLVISNRCCCSMVIDDCNGATTDEALDKMARWLRMLANGIEKRNKIEIPYQ
jgi:hypothetical protein